MTTLAGLSISPSFAEITVAREDKTLAQRRFFIASEPLGTSLQSFLKDADLQPNKVLVSSRFLRRILDTKLGGTVAQVVTSGFETWPVIRQSHRNKHFELTPRRQEPLASQELIFGVNERVSAQGEIITALDIKELEFIAAKLKISDVKRVVVNFLFSNKNPSHQKAACDFFKKEGFVVFSQARPTTSVDEVPAWRLNTINACLLGTFEDLKSEIVKGFNKDDNTQILFLDSQGKTFDDNHDQMASSIFGHAYSIQNLDRQMTHIYLGLDHWYISHQEAEPNWDSPWGLIELAKPMVTDLKIQPSTEVLNHSLFGFDFAPNELGFEPGPISLGRGHRLTVFDLLNLKYNLDGRFNLKQLSGTNKAKQVLQAMIKNNPRLQNFSMEEVIESSTQAILQEVITAISLRAFRNEVKLVGPWAPILKPDLQALSKGMQFQANKEGDFIDSEALIKILRGMP